MRRLSPWVIDNRPRQFRPRRRAPRPLVVPPPRPLAPTVDDARLAAWLQRGWGPGAPPYDRVTFRQAWDALGHVGEPLRSPVVAALAAALGRLGWSGTLIPGAYSRPACP